MTVQEISEVSSSWTRDHRVDQHPRRQRNLGPEVDLGQLLPQAVAVGMAPTISPFPAVQRQLDRSRAWDRLANETGGEAQAELVAARMRAVAVEEPTPQALNAYLEVKERLRPWSEHEPMNLEAGRPGRERRVVLAAHELAQLELEKASAMVQASTDDLYLRFAVVAAAAVAEVQRVLPLTDRAWSALDANQVLADEQRNVLHRSEATFARCHHAALYLRAMGVSDTDQALLTTEAPYSGLTFRRWDVASERRHELPRAKMLRLAFVVQNGFEPGLWRASDLRNVDQGPGRRRFLAMFGR